MTIRKAVIPAAGLGTRFLPATKSQPKEMLAVIDKPAIQYVVEEAKRAGIDDVLVVTSRGKSTLEDHFDRSPELEQHLERTGKQDQLAEIREVAGLASLHYVRQQQPLGFGHAVLMAREHVGDQPFVVMVGDEIVPEPEGDEDPLIGRMIEIHESTGGSVLAVQEVPKEDIPSYGIVYIEEMVGDYARIQGIVEKPAVADAPSNLASRGRYLFTPGIFDAIERTEPGVGDEIQLTDGVQLLAEKEAIFAYVHEGPVLDVGKKIDFLKATIELALRRDDLRDELMAHLRELVSHLER
ncbi:MAG: UTP--glucose-1-phosphate uridylyltransferase GalU [Actinomycetota bacterium]